MAQLYFVARYGCSYPNPEGVPLREARRLASADARASARRARQRYGYGATVHRLSPDCWRVTLASDLNSTLWDHFSVLPV